VKPDELRSLYRGGRPNDRARAIQQRFMLVARTGLAPFSAVLEVVGRRTGRPIQLPVVVIRVRGARYVVSMLGPTANWVRNVQAAQGRAVLWRGRRRPVRLVQVEPEEAAPVLRRYLLIARSGAVHMDITRGSTHAELVAAAPRYPTFRIDPAPAQ
jgi:deazaflavin-dependent oxidoreductase (nitroreductase family)